MKHRFHHPAATVMLVLAVLVMFSPVGKAFASGGWTDPAPVATTSTISESPSLVVDGSGKVYVVWSETDPITNNYWVDYASSVNSSMSGFSWNVSNVTAPSTAILFTPFVSLGLNNRLHVVWSEKIAGNNYDIFYSSLASAGGAWSGKAQVSNTPDFSTTPVTAVDSQGRVRLVWTDKSSGLQQIYSSSANADGTGWSAAEMISSLAPAPDNDVLAPALAIDSNDNVNVVWHSADKLLPIYYRKGSVSGGAINWGSPPIPINSTATGSQYPKIAAKGTDLYVVWSKEVSAVPGVSSTDDVYITKWTESGGWTTPVAIPLSEVEVSSVPPYNLVASNPDIAIDGRGVLHVVWHGKAAGDDTEKIYYSRSSDSGLTWSTPRNISGTGGPSVKPAIKVSLGGTAYVAWQDYRASSRSEIYFSGSTIQQIFLPIVMKGYVGGW